MLPISKKKRFTSFIFVILPIPKLQVNARVALWNQHWLQGQKWLHRKARLNRRVEVCRLADYRVGLFTHQLLFCAADSKPDCTSLVAQSLSETLQLAEAVFAPRTFEPASLLLLQEGMGAGNLSRFGTSVCPWFGTS